MANLCAKIGRFLGKKGYEQKYLLGQSPQNKSTYGINLVLPSTNYTVCQEAMRNALKSSPNLDIKTLWAETNYGTNLQYDPFQNTKQVLKSIQHDHKERINNTLLSRGSVISYIIENSCQNLKGLWSSV